VIEYVFAQYSPRNLALGFLLRTLASVHTFFFAQERWTQRPVMVAIRRHVRLAKSTHASLAYAPRERCGIRAIFRLHLKRPCGVIRRGVLAVLRRPFNDFVFAFVVASERCDAGDAAANAAPDVPTARDSHQSNRDDTRNDEHDAGASPSRRCARVRELDFVVNTMIPRSFVSDDVAAALTGRSRGLEIVAGRQQGCAFASHRSRARPRRLFSTCATLRPCSRGC
jgi:hypothetical protein